jgi:hypothetical protein
MILPQRIACFSITIQSFDMIQVSIDSQEARLFNCVAVQTPPASHHLKFASQVKNFRH